MISKSAAGTKVVDLCEQGDTLVREYDGTTFLDCNARNFRIGFCRRHLD